MLTTTAVVLSAVSMLVFGVWAYADPATFIQYVNYPPTHQHLTHDAGAFQIGIGAGLLLALFCRDSVIATLATFAIASGLHTVSHHIDRHLGGHDTDVPLLAVLTAIAVLGICTRLLATRPGRTDDKELS